LTVDLKIYSDLTEMIKNQKVFQNFENNYLKKRKLSYEEKLQIYESLYKEALLLGVIPGENPMEGIDVNIRLAKILNSCLKKP
jgi:hypothetical protein